MNPGERLEAGRKVTLVGAVVNLALTIVRFAVGLVSGSTAVLADALDSFTDTVMSGVLYLGFRLAGKKPDSEHHLGHGDLEPLAGLFSSVLIVALGFHMATVAFDHLGGPTAAPGIIALYVTLLTAGIKLGLYSYSTRAERDIESPALRAFASNFKGDLYASAVVAAGVIGARMGRPFLDPAAGLVVSVLVMKVGLDVGRENVLQLMGTVPRAETTETITETALDVDGVLHVHRVYAHTIGATAMVGLHICVDGDLTITKAHDIATEVQQRVLEKCPEVNYVLVHPEPFDRHHRDKYGGSP